jgi:hypothetical protein
MTAQPHRRSLRLQRKDHLTALPAEIHRCIGERLPTGSDVANFQLSGRPFRDAVPFAGFAPVLMLPFHPDGMAVSFYRPTDGETIQRNLPALRGKVVCGSSHGWLTLVDEAANVTLPNPFTGATADLSPANNCLGAACFTRVSTDSDNPHCILHYKDEQEMGRVLRLDEMRDELFREIVMSSQPDSGDCVAVALLARSLSVAVCRVGVDREWKLLDTDLRTHIKSIVHCHGSKFLAIGYNEEIAIYDTSRSTSTPRVMRKKPQPLYAPPKDIIWRRSYLQVDGKLHLVGTAYQNCAHHTRVYKGKVLSKQGLTYTPILF